MSNFVILEVTSFKRNGKVEPEGYIMKRIPWGPAVEQVFSFPFLYKNDYRVRSQKLRYRVTTNVSPCSLARDAILNAYLRAQW